MFDRRALRSVMPWLLLAAFAFVTTACAESTESEPSSDDSADVGPIVKSVQGQAAEDNYDQMTGGAVQDMAEFNSLSVASQLIVSERRENGYDQLSELFETDVDRFLENGENSITAETGDVMNALEYYPGQESLFVLDIRSQNGAQFWSNIHHQGSDDARTLIGHSALQFKANFENALRSASCPGFRPGNDEGPRALGSKDQDGEQIEAERAEGSGLGLHPTLNVEIIDGGVTEGQALALFDAVIKKLKTIIPTQRRRAMLDWANSDGSEPHGTVELKEVSNQDFMNLLRELPVRLSLSTAEGYMATLLIFSANAQGGAEIADDHDRPQAIRFRVGLMGPDKSGLQFRLAVPLCRKPSVNLFDAWIVETTMSWVELINSHVDTDEDGDASELGDDDDDQEDERDEEEDEEADEDKGPSGGPPGHAGHDD